MTDWRHDCGLYGIQWRRTVHFLPTCAKEGTDLRQREGANLLFSASNVVQASLAAARDQKQPVAYATSCIPLCGE